MSAPFAIVALPRSGTAWLSRALTGDGWTCHHQMAIQMRSAADVVDLFREPRTGTAETAIALGWRLLRRWVPGLRIMVVRRPVDECVASMLRVDVGGVARYDPAILRAGLLREARALDELQREPDVLTVQFRDLWADESGAAIFRHCLGAPFNQERWAAFREVNIQADVRTMLHYYQANRVGVDGFKAECKRELFRMAREGVITRMAA